MMYNLNTRHKFYEFITLYIIVFCTSSRITHTFASTNFYLNMKREKIELNELPYQTLAQFGLTQEMIEDLPMRVLDDLGDGRHSPVLPIEVTDENGERIKSRTRLAFIRKEDGQVDVMFYPALKTSPLERYDEAQQKQLLSGKAIIADVRTAEGRASKAFVQVDAGTNQVMTVPTPVIGRNLQVLAEQMRLGSAEVKGLQHGDPLTLIVDNDLVTVGIDLNAKTGIRMCRGDEMKWREQGKRDWDKYTFGVYGCWMMDDDGNLDYVPEAQYTDEIWNEQKKAGERNRAAAALHK